MKLGINFKTGHRWSLTSWISDEVPASGSFTFGGDPNGTSQLIVWWRGEVYWTSGLWYDQHFYFAPQLSYNDYYHLSYVSNENEKYFTYLTTGNYTFARYTMYSFGYLAERNGASFGVCSIPGDLDPGCVEQKQGECRNRAFGTDKRYGYMDADGFKFDESYNLSLFDCWAKCLNNCSRVAYASINQNGTGCEIWSPPTRFNPIDTRKEIYILVSKRAKQWRMWVIAALGALLVPLSCFLWFLILRKLRVQGKTKATQNMQLYELRGNTTASTQYSKANNHRKEKKMSNELHLFSFESIVAATNNFSTTNKLGQGGFGPVYKGKLLDGQEVAIKRLSRSSGQGLVEFENEILLIAKLQHTNLVRLLGCCIHGEERVLVYEYMPNKSLDFFLFYPSKKELSRWKDRFNIIEGIAQGLLYLHKYSRLTVIHRDLKPSNILLDEKMNPKISDFGMAKIFGLNESEANTNRVVGTYGYMSPEYAIKGIVSTKTDVFSFGVLLLEIVSGKKNNSCYHSEHPLNLIGYAWELWKEGKAFELTDPTLEDPCPHSEVVLRCIHVGLLCIQDHAMDRPSMSDVVAMLSNGSLQLPAPKQPALFIERQEIEVVENLENCSVNKLSISVMEAR